MSLDSSRQVIYAALVGNILIAIVKAVAAAWTGSAAMTSEAIHSVVDTGNEWLMLYGLVRSTRPADSQHSFGHGRELYFWVFVVGLLVFAGGGVVSIIEGIDKIRHPLPVEAAWINYLVLGAAIALESASFTVAAREFRVQKGATGYLGAMRRSKDPTVFAVLLEDVAALAGLVVAAMGILGAELLDMPRLDGIASVGIGGILVSVAGFLALEAKSLLIGEAASVAVVQGVRALADAEPGVEAVTRLLTQHFGPQDILVNLSLDFRDTDCAGTVEQTVARLDAAIKQMFPEITRVFIEIRGREGATACRVQCPVSIGLTGQNCVENRDNTSSSNNCWRSIILG